MRLRTHRKKGRIRMRKARKALVGVTATALLVAVALALPASSAFAVADGSNSPVASQSKKKKCKKKGKKGKKCKKKGGGGVYYEGRYAGTYAENNVDLLFNVAGGRVYTGPFDGFYIDATCYNTNPEYTGEQVTTDASAVEPVQATISGNGSFFGSGVYTPGFGLQMAWTLSGQIAGKSITGGTFSVNYRNYYGDPCSGSTSFTAQWYGSYVL
jgi:hypothetical protein